MASQVTIGANQYWIYGTYAAAVAYITANPLLSGAWNALASDDEREKFLVWASRTLDRLPWAGSKTGSPQPLAWPRNGVSDKDGNAVPDGTTPTQVEEACYELAGALAANPGLLGGVGGGSAVQGAVREVSDSRRAVSFFYSAKSVESRSNTKGALPRDVLELVREYFRGPAISATAYGTDGESAFDDPEDRFELWGGV